MKEEMNKYIFFLLFVLLTVGCKHNDDLNNVITTPNCYWDIHDKNTAIEGRISMCYRFNKDGSCLYLFTPNKKGEREEYYDDDVIVSKRWQIKGDTIYIREIERYIVNYSKDTLLLENPTTKERDTLIRNCN